jgi:transposase-like protein
MPQAQLPLFGEGMTQISQEIAFEKREGKVYYFNGHLPVFVHEERDLRTFRMFTTQLIINGTVSQAQIVRAFAVPSVTVKRSVKLYRQRGTEGFFKPAQRREGGRLTPEVLKQAQGLLEQGRSVPQLAEELGILATTLHKAIGDGRLRAALGEKKDPAESPRRRARANAA